MNSVGNQDRIRVGVVGVGWAGVQHLNAYQAIPGVEIVALAAKEADLVEELADRHNIPHRAQSYEELLEIDDIDAVSIAVPTFMHAPIAIAALQRGLHVLSEKPIARTSAEGQLMVNAARENGRVLEIVFNHRLRADVQALAQAITAGEIGRPYYAKGSWLRRRGIPLIGSWFTNGELAGGGPLIDIGVHVLDYSLHLLGEPRVTRVSASTYAELGPRGRGGAQRATADASRSGFEVEDFGSAFLHLEDGGTLVLEAGWAAYRSMDDLMNFSVLGTEGGASLEVIGGPRNPYGDLTVYRDGESGEAIDQRVFTNAPNRGHDGVIEDFIAHIRDPDSWARHDGSVALTRAQIIDACYLSAREQKEVSL
ncbi:Gfo/Idh/MocA family protein [Microbacterium sp. bgisy207]|uniref:Gfo/Idh/MocA family protein n=1 Tax=Microbacterium sp. bgisy207 TaxID=3413800 RepID=UPI003EBD84EE